MATRVSGPRRTVAGGGSNMKKEKKNGNLSLVPPTTRRRIPKKVNNKTGPGNTLGCPRHVGSVTSGGCSLSPLELLNISLQTSSNPSLRKAPNFSAHHRILLVGEGDFSFALALAVNLGVASRIVATSLDTRGDIVKKYGQAALKTLDDLVARDVTVLHKVDATTMATAPAGRLPEDAAASFDRILFNFPHVGGASEDEVEQNRSVIRGFLQRCPPLLSPRGEIHITLRDTPFYDRWDIPRLASDIVGVKLLRVAKFQTEVFTALGYTPKRTNPAVREAPPSGDAKLYIFTKDDGKAVLDTAAVAANLQAEAGSLAEKSSVADHGKWKGASARSRLHAEPFSSSKSAAQKRPRGTVENHDRDQETETMSRKQRRMLKKRRKMECS